MTNAASNVVTVPKHATVAFNTGDIVNILQYGIGPTSVTGAAGVTVNTNSTLGSAGQYIMLAVQQISIDSWVLIGHTQ